MNQVFYCPGCQEWHSILEATEVESAMYIPVKPDKLNFPSTWRRVFQPLLLCRDCLPEEAKNVSA